MTLREKKLLRLTRLRELQHDLAALQLRTAHHEAAVAESASKDAQECLRGARLCRLAVSAEDDANEWLITCADIEIAKLMVEKHQAEWARANIVLQKAAEIEAAARRERKQMETTLALAQRERADQAKRTEQSTLDEIARVQRAGSAARASWRRGF